MACRPQNSCSWWSSSGRPGERAPDRVGEGYRIARAVGDLGSIAGAVVDHARGAAARIWATTPGTGTRR